MKSKSHAARVVDGELEGQKHEGVELDGHTTVVGAGESRFKKSHKVVDND